MDRKFLPISKVSMLGSCEVKFMESMLEKREPTKFMKIGKEAHERLTIKLPKMTKEEIINEIKSKKPIQVRELPVYDEKMRICGRIDHLAMTGNMENGKNTGIIIDDKYPSSRSHIYGLTLYYKLQLASYAVALANSESYGNICMAVGAQLRYREKKNDSIISSYEMDRKRLEDCEANIDIASKVAWVLYENKRKPEHRRLDVENGEWGKCYCGIYSQALKM